MKFETIVKILADVKFNCMGVEFSWNIMDKGDGFLIQISPLDKKFEKGGKHYISQYAVKDEVVFKAWKACQDYVLYECRNGFRYKGVDIFKSHIEIDKLVDFVNNADIVRRSHNNYGIQDVDF